MDTPNEAEPILGFEFLNHFDSSIDWRQVLINLNSYHKDYYDPSKYCSNDFSSGKSFAAVIGDSRSPLFPAPVHIPSFSCHQSLLSIIYEFFKDIKDFRENNSISSLHLFHGNVDLTPSSHSDSLEELWDTEEEAEEIETLMKVFPSAYNHYLDLFSNVKAERHPPDCTCDHHIKLEGSLPPVGVIYSLPNQDSDTLRYYISESVERFLIKPRSSSK
ncbi:hypothetical protein O181_020575 [Austropuccinia psidii MF-1]|uniref:Uncharacterized protein n=1 Tax=Austropuccinia psidii MF-1 TaxID=1389203 RepID=A0A9Q3CCV0_9BASI|nr:hypothetical protein [Austropuccinia psidii MF-1]